MRLRPPASWLTYLIHLKMSGAAQGLTVSANTFMGSFDPDTPVMLTRGKQLSMKGSEIQIGSVLKATD